MHSGYSLVRGEKSNIYMVWGGFYPHPYIDIDFSTPTNKFNYDRTGIYIGVLVLSVTFFRAVKYTHFLG